MSEIDVKEMLAAGVHFGHKTSRRHPLMSEYIHSAKGDIHIIDLIQSADMLAKAMAYVSQQVSKGKQVLLVGTKRQAGPIISQAAEASGMPAVFNRWLGGMLTNSQTMKSRIKRLKELEEKMQSGELAQRYSKLEVQHFQEEIDKLNYHFGGIKDMANKPGVMYVTDVLSDDIAVREAQKLDIPIVAMVDTNADPSDIDFPIPANDDAIKSLQLITDYIVEAINEGKAKRGKVTTTAKSAPAKTSESLKTTKTQPKKATTAEKDAESKPAGKKTAIAKEKAASSKKAKTATKSTKKSASTATKKAPVKKEK